jgi:hypothetical protein
MCLRLSGFVVAASLVAPLSLAAQGASQPKSVTASVTVTTSDDRSALAVSSTEEPAFFFCISLGAPLTQKISYTGMARVVFRPLPSQPVPAGIVVEGPENVTSALGVLPSAGKGWLFLAKREATVLSAGEAAGVTTVPVSSVIRLDWVPARGGPRRGMDTEGCFNAGG